MSNAFSFTGLSDLRKNQESTISEIEEIRNIGITVLNSVSYFLALFVCVPFFGIFGIGSAVFGIEGKLSLALFFASEGLAFALIPLLAKKGFENTGKFLLIIYIDIAIIILSSIFGVDA